jgi:hypothetical protein
MPGSVVHGTAGITCPHGAPAQVVPGNPRVLVGGLPVATTADAYPVTGCPFQVPVGAGTKPQPCVRLQWTVPAARVLAGGAPVLVATSTGVALSAEQIPQGPPVVAAVQPRVVAT